MVVAGGGPRGRGEGGPWTSMVHPTPVPLVHSRLLHLKLCREQLIIKSLGSDKFLVGAHLADPVTVDHDQSVAVLEG